MSTKETFYWNLEARIQRESNVFWMTWRRCIVSMGFSRFWKNSFPFDQSVILKKYKYEGKNNKISVAKILFPKKTRTKRKIWRFRFSWNLQSNQRLSVFWCKLKFLDATALFGRWWVLGHKQEKYQVNIVTKYLYRWQTGVYMLR